MIKIACHGIIKKGERILLGLRNKPSCVFHGQYFTIGGGLEAGERLEECFRREAMEEANIHIKDVQMKRVREFIYDRGHSLVFIYTASYDKGDLLGNDDCLDPCFFTIDEIRALVSEGKVGSTVIENLQYLGEL
ncbi:MAG: NUDIX hydrolase [Alphaproteobacteria bacterium]|nr:NUDIX hydrolase [Alphaproteobacteria bacterium]MBN2780052.1 NUDIX hydrolase [Alphaproteobacteria bacterium]